MPSWLLKATAQGAISLLPGRHRLNYLLQKHLTRSVDLSEARFWMKADQCHRHLHNYTQSTTTTALPSSVLELGTGWHPIVPIGFALAGVPHITTIDASRLLNLDATQQTLKLYASHLRSERLTAAFPKIQPERAEAVIAAANDQAAPRPEELLGRLGIDVMVGDVAAAGLQPASVALFVSNNTLEHIPLDLLRAIIAQFRRLAAPKAVMSHFIDMSDHYAHFDDAITEFNYMRYSQRAWRVFNNRLHYQNRLRASDYRQIIEHAGFRMTVEEEERGADAQLDPIPLAAPFRSYARDDLLVLRSWMIAVAAPIHPPALPVWSRVQGLR